VGLLQLNRPNKKSREPMEKKKEDVPRGRAYHFIGRRRGEKRLKGELEENLIQGGKLWKKVHRRKKTSIRTNSVQSFRRGRRKLHMGDQC